MATRRPRGRWRRQQFRGFHAKVAHFLQMEGAVCIRGTRRASVTAPHRRQVPLLSWVRPQYHQDQQFFASLDLHSSAPPYHHTPWGPSSWQSDRPTLTVSSGYGGQLTRCASTACVTAMAPSCRSAHPRVFRRGPGQPTLMTDFWPTNQDPGYCLGPALRPLWAR